MRTVTRGFAQGLIVSLLVAGGIAACVDATRSTSTEPALSEGARVSLAGGSSISFQGLDGKVLSTAAHEWAVDAVVTNGIAEAKVAGSRSVDVGMPALAISDDHPLARGRPSQHQHISAKDRNGNLQDFVVITGEQGGPAKTIVHLANHKIDQSYS